MARRGAESFESFRVDPSGGSLEPSFQFLPLKTHVCNRRDSHTLSTLRT